MINAGKTGKSIRQIPEMQPRPAPRWRVTSCTLGPTAAPRLPGARLSSFGVQGDLAVQRPRPIFASTSAEPQGSDHVRFLRSWLSNPLRVAAIAPSGAALARLITREIQPEHAPVLELGPGTGVFTRALLGRGIDESDLTLVEMDADFADLLNRRFPRARIILADVATVSAAVLFPACQAGAVISGLGLLSMPQEKVASILHAAIGCLRPAGAIYQFTYGPRCPVPDAILQRLGLQARRIGGTFRNLPPASVYRISRRTPARTDDREASDFSTGTAA